MPDPTERLNAALEGQPELARPARVWSVANLQRMLVPMKHPRLNHQTPLALAALLLWLLVSCERAPTPLPDPEAWTRPVAAGVSAFVFPPVADEERTRSIRLVRELVIEPHGDDFNYLFGDRAPHVSVDDQGRMFVADVANARVLAFDQYGEHVRTFGRSGQGPGEFSFPIASVVAGDHLYVSDSNASRLSRWTLSGELDWDIRVGVFPGYLVPPAVGFDDGTWLVRFRIPRTSTEVVAHMSAQGTRISEFAPIEVPGRIGYPPDEPRLMIYAGSTPPTYAADRDGRVYVSPLEEYQIFSYGLDTNMRWALQVPVERPALADEEKEWAAAWFRNERYSDIRVGDIEWPEQQYALSDVKVDGHGRIYAFPYVPRGVIHDRLPVDVYAPDGTRILGAWLEGDLEGFYWVGSWKPGPMVGVAWQTAKDDLLYGVLQDPETDVYTVVRYRIEFPE